ncbi:MAG: glycosyl hydrolase 2 galactose-binding domain-containing protein, partial [Prolixibacteraceae bacterium]
MKRRNFVRNSSLGLAVIMAANQVSGQLPFLNPINDESPKNSRKKLLDNWQLFALEENGELNKTELNSLPAQNTKVYSCSIPAQVHDVLTEKGVIEDPIHFEAQEPCLWVAEKDWVYQTQFAGTDAQKVFLHFKGLDTIADIYLNEEKIFTNESCFLPARVEITGKLTDNNKLLIHFYAPKPWLEKNKKAQQFVDEG